MALKFDDSSAAALFYVTAGRGTEVFVGSEIKERIQPSEISSREGKVFFSPAHYSASRVEEILSLKSVERAFVAVTDYDNSVFIQTKRNFLDKLMTVLSTKEHYNHAKIVLKQLRMLYQSCWHTKKPFSSIKTEETHGARCDHRCSNNSFNLDRSVPLIRNAETVDKKSHSPVEPLKDMEKCGDNLFRKRKSSDLQKQLDVDCETNFSSQLYDDSDSHEILDIPLHHCASASLTETHPPASCDEPQVLKQAAHSKRQCLQDEMDHSKSSAQLFQSCSANMTDESEQDRKYSSDDFPAWTFRISVKCSGKVKKWINLKRLSRDAGWRVAKASGWMASLRNPDIEVCVHISDDCVTVGIPLSRYPLSKREYLVDSGLRAPIAWIMCQLANIQPGDIVLDPMCGKGTILIEASSSGQHVTYLGNDNSVSQLASASQNLTMSGFGDHIALQMADGLNMPYRDGCIDVVMCDAPFNQKFTLSTTPELFYTQFLKEIYRVLRSQGRCVLLISQEMSQIVRALTEEPAAIKKTFSSYQYQGGLPSQAVSHIHPKNKIETSKGESIIMERDRTTAMSVENNTRKLELLPTIDLKYSGGLGETVAKLSERVSDNPSVKDDFPSVSFSEGNSNIADLQIKRQWTETSVTTGSTHPLQLGIEHLDPLKEDCSPSKAALPLCLISDHYVKLGETHACILVLIKL